MNSLDIILLTPIAIGFILGFFKGLIKELTSLLGLVVGIYGAKLMAPELSDFLVQNFDFKSSTALPFAYLLIFVGILLALFLLTKSIEKLLQSISLDGVNKILGGFFGGLKWALIVSVLLTIFDAVDHRFSLIQPKLKKESLVYQPLMVFAPQLWDKTIHELQ